MHKMDQRKRILLPVVLLVVIGHTDSPVGGYIYLFHVAAFFFISGYTTNLSKGSFFEYSVNKFTSWMVPFFTIFSRPAKATAVAGSTAMPSDLASETMAANACASVTDSMVPPNF